jgi:hypothetical protein
VFVTRIKRTQYEVLFGDCCPNNAPDMAAVCGGVDLHNQRRARLPSCLASMAQPFLKTAIRDMSKRAF